MFIDSFYFERIGLLAGRFGILPDRGLVVRVNVLQGKDAVWGS